MESTLLRRVKPTRPIAAYIGGKKRLAADIVGRIDRIPHHTYAEPFVGMGGVFLRRQCAPAVEVINDVSTDVANLFRVVQRHCGALEEALHFHLTARSVFDRFKLVEPSSLTDIERAARFLYLQRAAFGGKVAGRSFGVSPTEPGAFNVSKLRPLLADLAARLSGVVIENLPYASLIERYDRPGTLFYLDPPYFGCEDDYGAGVFGRSDFERLAAQLASLQGIFLLSINDTPEIRRIFSAFRFDEVRLRYSISEQGSTEARELIFGSAAAFVAAPQANLFG